MRFRRVFTAAASFILTCLPLSACLTLHAHAQGWVQRPSGTTQTLYGVHSLNGATTFAVGAQGTIIISTNGGSTWAPRTSGTPRTLYDITSTSGISIHAVGAFGAMVFSSDFGMTWVPHFSGSTATIRAIRMTSSSDGVFVGSSGHIFTTTNNGNNWTYKSLGLTADLYDIAFRSDGAIFASGDTGFVVQSSDNWSSWTTTTTAFFAELRSIAFATADIGIAVDAQGRIFRTTDGGATWPLLASPAPLALNCVIFNDPSTGYICGAGGRIYRTTDAGLTWSQQYTGVTNELHAIAFTGPDYGLVVGAGGMVLQTINGGTPVELASFAATQISDTQVRLSWRTETETACLGYDLERRVGAGAWVQRTHLPGAGTSTRAREYVHIDNLPLGVLSTDTIVYRLRQHDTDGRSTLLPELRFSTSDTHGAPEMRFDVEGPLPAHTALSILVTLVAPAQTELHFCDMMGRMVQSAISAEFERGTHRILIPVGNLPSGAYVAVLRSGGRMRTRVVQIVHPSAR